MTFVQNNWEMDWSLFSALDIIPSRWLGSKHQLTNLSNSLLCFCALARGPDMAATLRGFRAEYYPWSSDWLKLLGWLAARNSLSARSPPVSLLRQFGVKRNLTNQPTTSQGRHNTSHAVTFRQEPIADFPGKHSGVVSLELLDFGHDARGRHFGFAASDAVTPHRQRVVESACNIT